MTISADVLRIAAAFSVAAYEDGSKTVSEILSGLGQPAGSAGWIVNGSSEWTAPLLGGEYTAPTDWTGIDEIPGTDSRGYYRSGNAAAIAAVKNGTLVIAFRGSDAPLIDDYDDAINDPQRHYDALHEFITAAIDYANANSVTKVIVTGHSLGGEMAQLFAVNEGEGLSSSITDIVTFGNPGLPNFKPLPTAEWADRISNFGHTEDIVFNDAAYVPTVGDLTNNRHAGFDFNIDLRTVNSTGAVNGTLTPSPFNPDGVFIPELVGQGVTEHWKDNYFQSALAISRSLGFSEIANIKTIVVGDNNDNTITVGAGARRLVLGMDGNDFLVGGTGNDVIDGGIGNDALLSGGDGDDVIYGGGGNDKLRGDRDKDVLYGGTGNDTAIYDDLTFRDHFDVSRHGDIVTVTTKSKIAENFYGSSDTLHNVEFLQFFDGRVDVKNDPRVKTDLSAGTSAGGDVSDGGVNPVGGGDNGNDATAGNVSSTARIISGDATSQNIYGSEGVETIRGMAGDDVLTGYAGKDTFDGGTGSDTVDYSYQPEDLSGTIDLAADTATFPGFYTETLTNIENVWMGAGNDTVFGDGGANDLRGGPGDDVLKGGAGNDRVYGDWKFSDQGGEDTAILAYTFGAGYKVSGTAKALHIVGSEGEDWYYNVEDFQFAGAVTKTAAEVLQVDTFALGAQTIERISIASNGIQGNGASSKPSISNDGRYVAFSSNASNLFTGDTNGKTDIFVYDRDSGGIEHISATFDGSKANGESWNPEISADGRYVAFVSLASNIVAGDTNNTIDVFVYDRVSHSSQRVPNDNLEGNAASVAAVPSISADGRYVAFLSGSSGGGANGDVLIYDRIAGTIEQANNGPFATYFGPSSVSLSADGTYVAFDGQLAPGPQILNIYLHNRAIDTTAQITTNGYNLYPSVSADGRFVAFAQWTYSGDPTPQIYVFDRATNTTELVSIAPDGTPANEHTTSNRNGHEPHISADGRYVTFSSAASNLVSNDTNGKFDIFVYDRTTHTTARLSVAGNGTQSNSNSIDPFISADGRFIVFASMGSTLVSGDTNGVSDVFVIDRAPNGTLIARADALTTAEDLPVSGNVLIDNGHGADDDPDGNAFSVVAVNGSISNLGRNFSLASGALLVVNPDGRFVYDPNRQFNGLDAGQTASDSFTYAISDGQGSTATATVSLTISGVANGLKVNGGAGTLNGTAQNDEIAGGVGNETIHGNAGYDWLQGGDGNDKLNGNDGNDIIEGGAGNDTLTGGEGYDWLDGGPDADRMAGGLNGDIYVVDSTGDVVSELTGQGTDFVRSSISYTLPADVENLELEDSGDIDGRGNAANNVISGNGGKNILKGFGGVDTLSGGLGDDLLQGGPGADMLDGGEGEDTASYADIVAGLAIALGDGGAKSKVTGGDTDTIENIEHIVGGGAADKITGNALANKLFGGPGLDVIAGGLGDDLLDGGAGVGDTVSYAGGAAVTVDLSKAGIQQDTVGAGKDTLSGFENLTGSDNGDTLTGDGFANTINGGLGDDLIEGLLGNDMLKGGGVAGNLGNDTVSYEHATKGVTVNLANTTAAQNTVGAGSDTLSGFENITGSAFADVLIGNGLANTLTGGDGDDLMNGGLGNDVLSGGAGGDLFRYGATSHGKDSITDFVDGDHISIVKLGFGIAAGVGPGKAGALNFENEYFIGAGDPAATKAHGQFLFDTDSHQLFWDGNGVAANGITLIATFSNNAVLDANDFELR